MSPARLSTKAVVNLVTVAAVALFWLVSTSWQPWNLFARGPFSADFYDEQARVFLRGRLDVDPAVSSIEGFVVDGKHYLYYGPFLAIVRMPFQLFGDLFTSRLVRASMIVALVVLCRWAARLARAARAVVAHSAIGVTDRPQAIDERWVIGLFTAAVAFSPALFASGWITVYHETELWACALAVVAVTLIAEWAAGGFTSRRLLLGAAAATVAATLTRPPIGLGIGVALGVCGLVLIRRGSVRTGAAAAGGALVALAAHVTVNFAKFGSLTSVPGSQQVLSFVNPERAAWFAGNGDSFFSPRFLTTTITHYLRPDAVRFERLVPGIRYGPPADVFSSYPLLDNTPSSSLTVSATALLLAAVVGTVWIARHRPLTWGLLLAGATVGALPTLLIGFIAQRYLIDMLPALAVAGALGVWAIAGWAAASETRARVAAVAGVVLIVWGAWVNVSLATWSGEQQSAGFAELRYRIDDALFPAPSPGLALIEPGDPPGRYGLVGLDVDPDLGCLGVYTADDRAWVALDLGGARRITRTFPADAVPVPLASGDTWNVDLDLSDAQAARVVLSDEFGAMTGEIAVGGWTATADDVTATVVVDPIEHVSYLAIDGTVVFLPPEIAGPLRPVVDAGADVGVGVDVESDLCRRLLARL